MLSIRRYLDSARHYKPQSIQAVYLYLVLGNTLAASFIWGINTIFLLSAGLSNFEAFLANGFFSLGEIIFEVPTGIIADTYGRRTSYLLGAVTLAISTFLYLLMWQAKSPFIGWALSSVLLGLGFTFFSGALEAWLMRWSEMKVKWNFVESRVDLLDVGDVKAGPADTRLQLPFQEPSAPIE